MPTIAQRKIDMLFHNKYVARLQVRSFYSILFCAPCSRGVRPTVLHPTGLRGYRTIFGSHPNGSSESYNERRIRTPPTHPP